MAVRVTVYGTADMKQIASARDELDRLERTANASAGGFVGSMTRISQSATKTGEAMMATGASMTRSLTIPLAAVGFGLYKATQAAAEDAQQQVMLATTMRNTAAATNEQIASTERWITAQGKAFGIADDQLRPALASLVTATGDVTKAQSLAGVAMDIAAAKGIDVETAANALSKAYAGSTTSLGKMLPGIDKAVLASGDFAAIQAEVARIVGGQAAKAADTEAGARAKANVALNEAIESLGTSFLPIMTDVTNMITTKVVPAIQRFADWFGKLDQGTKQGILGFGVFLAALGPVVSILGAGVKGFGLLTGGILGTYKATAKAVGGVKNLVDGITNAHGTVSAFATPMQNLGARIRSGALAIGQFVAATWAKISALAVSTGQWIANTAAMIAHKTATLAISVATKAAAAGQWLLNAAMTANPIGLVVAAIAALVAGLVWFFTQTQIGKDIWAGFTGFLASAWQGLVNFLSQAWDNITKFFNDAINNVVNFVRNNWGLLLSLIIGPMGLVIQWIVNNWSGIVRFFSGVWNSIVSGVSGMISNVIGYFQSLGSRVQSILSGAGSWLVGVGRDIVSGLWNGLSSGWSWLTGQVNSLVSGLVSGVKRALGIRSPSRVFAEIGNFMSEGMANGIQAGVPAVSKALDSLATMGAATVAAGTMTASLALGGAGGTLTPGVNLGMSPASNSKTVTVAQGAIQVNITGDTNRTDVEAAIGQAFDKLVKELRAR